MNHAGNASLWQNLTALPIPFWLLVGVMIVGVVRALRTLNDGTGMPILAVLATIGAWYIGDAFYNDYANYHVKAFSNNVLQAAWMQTAWFVLVFIVATPEIHRWFNASYLRQQSGVLRMFRQGVNQPVIQQQLKQLLKISILIWLVIGVLATARLGTEVVHFFFPYIGYKAEPWGRARIGSGIDAFLSAAFYFQLLVSGIFGVVAALAADRGTRWLAILFCLLAWPYFILDRTRNTMLAAVVPGMLCWSLLRIRGGLIKKGLVLGACFILVNAWMKFVIANRTGEAISVAIREKGFSLESKAHNQGLNMFEELCWITKFNSDGLMHADWGRSYFADAVNFIPRTLWPGKPTIGLDYAIARGLGGGAADQGGVVATFSTGLIGQGVVNFGWFFGPAAAAVLMSFWAACLARLDLNVQRLGYLPLYGTAMILTFNLGRDISLLTLYPFIFGWIGAWWIGRHRREPAAFVSPPPGRAYPQAPAPAAVQGARQLRPRLRRFVRRG